MSTWVPLCPSCRVPLRQEGVELHDPPSLTSEEDRPQATLACRFCDQVVTLDASTKWARIA